MWNGRFEYFQGRGVLPYLIALNQLERLKTRKNWRRALPISSPTRHSLLYEARVERTAQLSKGGLNSWEIAGCSRSDSSAPLPLLHWEQISHLPFRYDLICFNRLPYGAPASPPPPPPENSKRFLLWFWLRELPPQQLTLPSLGAFLPWFSPLQASVLKTVARLPCCVKGSLIFPVVTITSTWAALSASYASLAGKLGACCHSGGSFLGRGSVSQPM